MAVKRACRRCTTTPALKTVWMNLSDEPLSRPRSNPVKPKWTETVKFHLAINLERTSADTSIRDVRHHVEDMIRMADDAGFEIAWGR